jgi:hypothetical protein
MRFLIGTKNQMLSIRDLDSLIFGYPYGETLRKWDVILRDGEYLYPYDLDFKDWSEINNPTELIGIDTIEDNTQEEHDIVVIE